MKTQFEEKEEENSKQCEPRKFLLPTALNHRGTAPVDNERLMNVNNQWNDQLEAFM